MNVFKLQQYIGISYLSLDDKLTLVPDHDSNNLLWKMNGNMISNYNNKVLVRSIVDPNIIVLDDIKQNNKLEFVIVGTPIGKKILEKTSGFFLAIKVLPDNKFQLILTNTICDQKEKIVIDWLASPSKIVNVPLNKIIGKKEGFNTDCDSKNRSMWLMVFLIIILFIKYFKKDI